jgi:hypothetical protein
MPAKNGAAQTRCGVMTGGSSSDEPVAADQGIAEAGGDVAASSMLQTASLLLVATRTTAPQAGSAFSSARSASVISAARNFASMIAQQRKGTLWQLNNHSFILDLEPQLLLLK